MQVSSFVGTSVAAIVIAVSFDGIAIVLPALIPASVTVYPWDAILTVSVSASALGIAQIFLVVAFTT